MKMEFSITTLFVDIGGGGSGDPWYTSFCLGGRITGHALALEIVKIFLSAQFSSADRHRRRLGKVAKLES